MSTFHVYHISESPSTATCWHEPCFVSTDSSAGRDEVLREAVSSLVLAPGKHSFAIVSIGSARSSHLSFETVEVGGISRTCVRDAVRL